MKYLLALILPLAAFAADPAPAPATDWQAVATILRQQRDAVTQQLQDAQAQLAIDAQQIAALQKQVAAAKAPKPSPSKP